MNMFFVYLPDATGKPFVAGTIQAQAEDNDHPRHPGAMQKARNVYGKTAFVACAGHVSKPRVGNPR